MVGGSGQTAGHGQYLPVGGDGENRTGVADLTRQESQWVDAVNPPKTYDAVATDLSSQHLDQQWNQGQFQKAVQGHLDKADFVPIDVSGLTPAQASTVESWVRDNSLGPRVFIVGDPGG